MNDSFRLSNQRPLVLLVAIACSILFAPNSGNGQTSLPKLKTKSLDDPVVEIVRESNPTTASELVYAMKAMVNYGQIDEVRRYQKSLMALEIDDATMFDLNMKYGSELFIQFRQIPELRPAAAVFARRIFEASNRFVRSPDRIGGFINQLSDENVDRRVAAIAGLMTAREDAIQPLMRELLDESKKDIHPRMVSTIASMGPDSIEPVKAIAKSDDVASYYKAGAIMHLQKDRGILPLLCGKLLASKPDSEVEAFTLATFERVAGSRPSRKTAVDFLRMHFDKLRHQSRARKGDVQPVTHWTWNATDKTLLKTEQPLSQSLLAESVEVANWIRRYHPDNVESQLRYWLLKLEYEKLALDPHAKLDASKFSEIDIEFALMILDEAVKQDRMEAAIAAAELLGQMGDVSLLQSAGGQKSLMARTLTHPNYRLRFAATQAVANWNPVASFSGSSYYLKNLAMLAGATNERRVLVLEPNEEMADDMAGFLSSAGLYGIAFNDGHDFLKHSTERIDYEFAVISGSVNRPGTFEVLQRLRRTPYMGSIPVALIGHSDQMTRLREYADTDPLTLAFSWPTNPTSLQFMADKMQMLADRNYVSPEQRMNDAGFAFDQLLKIARDRKKYPFFNFLQYEPMFSRATYEESLSPKSIELLGLVATASAQQNLINLASSTTIPVPTRKIALAAFAKAIQLRDILLTSDELQAQYDHYNASEFLDKETQDIRSAILDLLEARSKGKAK